MTAKSCQVTQTAIHFTVTSSSIYMTDLCTVAQKYGGRRSMF
jgi:hypothetical protein